MKWGSDPSRIRLRPDFSGPYDGGMALATMCESPKPRTGIRLPRRPAQPKTPLATAPRELPAAASAKAPRRVAKKPAVAPDPAANDALPVAGRQAALASVPTPKPTLGPAARPRKTAHLAPAGALPPARIPPEALASPRNDKLLTWAFTISLAVHAVAATLHFRPFDLKPATDKGPPLEVALVNAKTAAKPTKADILAQANLDGGGNTDANRRAKTPLPVLPKESVRQEVAVATQRVETLERQTKELLTQLQSAPTVAIAPRPSESDANTETPTANELMQRTLEALRLEAQIAKDMDAYQKRPKRRFVGARAEEYRFARYVEDWRLKVERIGNLNYPEAARQQKLYGSLLITVSIKPDGSVESIEINRSSGQKILDAAAVRIVEMAAPYAQFPSDIRRDTDILHITRTWTFTKADALVSE